MSITKFELKILKFIYSKRSVSYSQLSKKFSKNHDFPSTLEMLIYQQYISQTGGSRDKYGDPVPITDDTLFKIDKLGAASVEPKQWFNIEYVISHIVIPIVIAIITTLITLFLTTWLLQ